MYKLILLTILTLHFNIASAYIDTTDKSFKKPKAIKPHAYKYQESKLDKYIDVAADKLGGSVLGTVVTGPVGLMMKVSNKVMQHQEDKASSSNHQ